MIRSLCYFRERGGDGDIEEARSVIDWKKKNAPFYSWRYFGDILAISKPTFDGGFSMISATPPGLSESPEGNRMLQEVDLGEDKRSTVADLKEKGKELKWVSVAQDKRCLKKYEVEVKSVDGKHKVVIPGDILSEATPLWEDFIVGKFLDIAPHIAKVHMVVNKIWSYGDSTSKVEVYDVNATTMRFKVKNPKVREKIIKRGMWNIAGVPMVVKKWSPKTEEEKQEEEAIPMWVHLRKVPLHMFSWEALSFMTSTVGFPVYLHPETIACSNFEEAKIFVNVDVSKALPKEIDFAIEGKEFTAEFYYPWLPSRCNICEKWGHSENVCVKKKREMKHGDMDLLKGSATKAGNEDIRVSGSRGMGEESGILRKKSNEKQLSTDGNGEGVSNAEGENVWFSPGRAGRVGRSLSKTPGRVDQVMQISASKFSVLSVDDVEEGEIQKDESHETEEVNIEEEDANVITEEDLLEDEILEQKTKENEKGAEQKGGRKVQKTKAQDANPKSKRSSRRKL